MSKVSFWTVRSIRLKLTCQCKRPKPVWFCLMDWLCTWLSFSTFAPPFIDQETRSVSSIRAAGHVWHLFYMSPFLSTEVQKALLCLNFLQMSGREFAVWWARGYLQPVSICVLHPTFWNLWYPVRIKMVNQKFKWLKRTRKHSLFAYLSFVEKVSDLVLLKRVRPHEICLSFKPNTICEFCL